MVCQIHREICVDGGAGSTTAQDITLSRIGILSGGFEIDASHARDAIDGKPQQLGSCDKHSKVPNQEGKER